MKAIKLLVFIALILVSGQRSFAQDATSAPAYKFTVKTNPLSALGGPFWVVVVPITGEYKASFEAALGKKSSFQLGAAYIGPSLLLNLDEITSEGSTIAGVKTGGFRVQGTFKYFISRDLSAPEGFYVGPNVSYASASIKDKGDSNNSISATKLNINAVIGYQMITSGGFTLDIFTGMGFVTRDWTISSADFDADTFKDKSGVSIPLGVSFGYAF